MVSRHLHVNFSFLLAHLSFVKFLFWQLTLASVWFDIIFMFSLDPQIIQTHILQDTQTLIKQAPGSVARFPYLGDVVDVHGALKEIFDGSSFNCEDCFEQG